MSMGLMTRVQFLQEVDIYLLCHAQTSFWVHPVSYPMVLEAISLEVKFWSVMLKTHHDLVLGLSVSE
jgi:hypothetical protein